MKLSQKDKRLMAVVMHIEALTEIALSDIAVAIPYKKGSATIHEWEMIQQTLQEIMNKVEWITDKFVEETNQEYVASAIEMGYEILRAGELIKEEE